MGNANSGTTVAGLVAVVPCGNGYVFSITPPPLSRIEQASGLCGIFLSVPEDERCVGFT